ncbi:unnamed protein product [Caenorhabditis auriculariae]|uniref:Uncharacterized protein n=1 Tax=Caenorhabditis auriculariae TaxID=2777116 RepID=A0A8S1HW89_9PELO|nr:unnamed protein product [Caenorhabditis auriculariae]
MLLIGADRAVGLARMDTSVCDGDQEAQNLTYKPDVVGVTLSRKELCFVVTMYVVAVTILVFTFEFLKPSLLGKYLFETSKP